MPHTLPSNSPTKIFLLWQRLLRVFVSEPFWRTAAARKHRHPGMNSGSFQNGSRLRIFSEFSIPESHVRMLPARPLHSNALFSWLLFSSVNFSCKLQFRSEVLEQSSPLPQCRWELLPRLSSWGCWCLALGRGPGTQRDDEHSTEQAVAWESSPQQSSLPSFCFFMELFPHYFFLSVFSLQHMWSRTESLIWAGEVLSARQNQDSQGWDPVLVPLQLHPSQANTACCCFFSTMLRTGQNRV